MFAKQTLIILIVLFMYSTSISPKYTKIIHNTDPQAKCLDGSPPMIYLHEGMDKNNIMIYFMGGGTCLGGTDLPSALENCYRKSKGEYGGSTLWPNEFDASGQAFYRQILKNQVIIMYCDGAYHQGNNKSPIKYKDSQLYFRGAVNTRSHLEWINKMYGLNKAEKIIVSGSSGGGMATYLWIDYIRSLVVNPNSVYGIVDSGIFYNPQLSLTTPLQDHISLTSKQHSQRKLRQEDKNELNPLQILMQLSNVDEKPPNKQCCSLFSDDQAWKCLLIQFCYSTLKKPLLFIQSSYDQVVIQDGLGLKCITEGESGYTLKNCTQSEIEMVQSYRMLYLEKFVPQLLKYGHSLWSISCVWHAQMANTTIYNSDQQKVPKQRGLTIKHAVESFLFEQSRIIAVDQLPWPANTPCAY